MHIITLSFDDGFQRSNTTIAEIYETYNLSACFNVVATVSLKDSSSLDSFQTGSTMGTFDLWNDLLQRGHEIHPHGYNHSNKADLPLADAQKLIRDCLDIFRHELEDFDPARAIFNFPYNASTPELEAWLSTVVKAFRVSGDGINPLPYPGMQRLSTTCFGPDNCETHLDQQIDRLLSRDSGWLLYTTHGLDEEGYGPIRGTYLDKLLKRLTAIESVRVLPAAKALALADESSYGVKNHPR